MISSPSIEEGMPGGRLIWPRISRSSLRRVGSAMPYALPHATSRAASCRCSQSFWIASTGWAYGAAYASPGALAQRLPLLLGALIGGACIEYIAARERSRGLGERGARASARAAAAGESGAASRGAEAVGVGAATISARETPNTQRVTEKLPAHALPAPHARSAALVFSERVKGDPHACTLKKTALDRERELRTTQFRR